MNIITLSGTIAGKPFFVYANTNGKFYLFYMVCKRNSGTTDVLPCIVNDEFLEQVKEGKKITIIGEIKTKDEYPSGKRKVCVFVFVKSVCGYLGEDKNKVTAIGKTGKKIDYRETPLGRKISSLTVFCESGNGELSCIPSIVWGNQAKNIHENRLIGTFVFDGRLQSRVYTKNFNDGNFEIKVTYEFSINKIKNLKKSKIEVELDE